MSNHRRALLVIASAAVLDVLCGLAYGRVEHIWWLHGVYCGLADALTHGGDVPPTRPAAYVILVFEYLTVYPLLAATVSLFTSGLTESRVRKSEARIKQHVDEQLAGHHKAMTEHHARHLNKLAEDVGDLADATRAVLQHNRKPRTAPPTGENT